MVVEDGGMTPYVSGAQWINVTHITTPPFNTDKANEIKKTLKQHGCQIEERQNQYILMFPEGTKKKRVGLVTMSERYMIHFPDGFQLFQHYDVMRNISLLYTLPE